MYKAENSQYLDGLILQALRQDDEKALDFLFSNYYNKLFRFGVKLSSDSDLTQEAIQLVFRDLWLYRQSLAEIQSFEAYLKSSLKKRIFKELSKKKLFENIDSEHLENQLLAVESYEQIMISQEENNAIKSKIKQALESLSPRQKEVISMKYFDELSYKEISEKTDIQVDTIYKILHEGIKRLRGILK